MAKPPPPGKWQYTVGEVPMRLTAFERTDKGNRIYTRVWDGRRYRDKSPLYGTIRNNRGGIVPGLEQVARTLALARYNELAAGGMPTGATGALTLGAGFRRVLHPKAGKYPADSQQKKDVARGAAVIQRVLGAGLPWSRVRNSHYRKLWREMAHEHRKAGKHGLRATEVVCGALQSASRWLQQEGLLEPGDGEPARGWKATLRSEWADITERPLTKPAQPRYSEAELRKLWRVLPKADPRMHLAMEIGAELRLGQLPRTLRSDVLPSPDGRFRIGMVRVHGRGKKHGELILLTTEQRHALTRAMTRGYLAELETAYQAGEIDDYYLIPAGKMRGVEDSRRGKVLRARVRNANKSLGKTGLRKQWRKLEELAGVEHMEWRNWYGVRRKQSDLAEDVETDARVLNRLGAWTHTATREHYQEQGRPEILEKVARTRRKIRPRRSDGGTP